MEPLKELLFHRHKAKLSIGVKEVYVVVIYEHTTLSMRFVCQHRRKRAREILVGELRHFALKTASSNNLRRWRIREARMTFSV